MKEQYACNANCPHYYSQFNNCVFYLDLATGMCDTASYNHNINKFCPYAKENIMLGEYRIDDDHPTKKGETDHQIQTAKTMIEKMVSCYDKTEKGGVQE